MGSVAAPLAEEPAFRGYCQVILEREFRGPIAVVFSSILFVLAHGPTQGFLWPKLLFYFLVGVVFGTIACLTKSILPAIPAYILGLLVFFTYSMAAGRDAATGPGRRGGHLVLDPRRAGSALYGAYNSRPCPAGESWWKIGAAERLAFVFRELTAPRLLLVPRQ
jgi:Type II CAAX prenyl endopeptidase Rce1-like